MGQTLRMCDGAITTNQSLAARIAEFTGFKVSVVPNFINREQLEISDEIFNLKKSSNYLGDGKISLGYFSGSPSHQMDYAILLSALEHVLANNNNVDLTVVGYIDVGSELAKFGKRITYKPFHDYVNLQRLIGSIEFNLMPLQINRFTNCKSDLKYFEAAIVGTVSIASPSDTYSTAIQNGKNGYIALAHQWSSVITNAIDGMDDYSSIAENARNDAYLKYAWFNQASTIVESLGFK
jgi:glycosyltransferase involved in cell wall biosynthesis